VAKKKNAGIQLGVARPQYRFVYCAYDSIDAELEMLKEDGWAWYIDSITPIEFELIPNGDGSIFSRKPLCLTRVMVALRRFVP